MGSIIARRRRTGGTAYLARIRIKNKGRIIYEETRTLETHRAARNWIRDRETELSKPGAIERATAPAQTLSQAIDQYTTDAARRVGRTAEQVFRAVQDMAIAETPCDQIGSREIVALAKSLSKDKKPQTVANYLAHLSGLFRIARPAWGYALDPQAMKDALAVCRRLGIIAPSDQRDRRPTLAELDRLMEFFDASPLGRHAMIPMRQIIAFAIFSTRRQSEITRIRWDDLDGSRIIVRDMKNPTKREGNNVHCDLTPEALAIIRSMPRIDPRIFPFNPQSIGTAFSRACTMTGINTETTPDEDCLKFHDLRHEGISRLFEIGLDIPRVSAVSGHRSWVNLKRYTHIRHSGDKYEGWPWLARITTAPPPHTHQPAHGSAAP